MITMNGIAKKVQLILIRKAYPCSQLDVISHANGVATVKAINNKRANSR